jgi:hypothetical protein
MLTINAVSILQVCIYLQENFGHFHEYLIQHYLKSGGTKYHFKLIKVPGTSPC